MSIAETNLDVLWGVDSIAVALGRTPRATYHLLESGHLDLVGAKKIGGKWCVTRRSLTTLFESVAA